jgi:polar amino acid transport system substrate-binding protein
MRKIWMVIIVFSIFPIFCFPVYSGDKIISLATLKWEPYAGENLENYGFHSEIVNKAFEKAGYKVKIEFKPWKRVLKEVEIGKYDAFYCAYYTEERAKIYGFSDPYGDSVLGFFKKKDRDIRNDRLEDLAPYRISVTLGYANTKEFDAADYLKKDTSPTDEVSLKKLEAGRVDLALLDKYIGYHILNNSFAQGKSSLEFMDPPLALNKLYLCFSRAVDGWEQKLADFNNGLKLIREEGTYDKILKAHGF